MSRLLLRSATLLAAFALSAQPAIAQTRIVGRVLENNSGMPVVNARVEVFDINWRRRAYLTTDSAGMFTTELRAPGGYRMRANRLGYQPNATPLVWTNSHSYMQIEVRLDRRVVLLAPIEVVAATRRLPSPVLENFRARQRGGFGIYITRAEIERRRPSTVTDLLATVS